MDQLSRVEAILESKINGTSYDQPPQSRIEYLLLQLQTGGGGGGSVDLTKVYQRLNDLEEGLSETADKIIELEKHALLDSSYGTGGDQ